MKRCNFNELTHILDKLVVEKITEWNFKEIDVHLEVTDEHEFLKLVKDGKVIKEIAII